MEGSEVFYSCDTGFVPEGRMRSVCTRNGWSSNPADLNCTAGMYMSHGTLGVVRWSKRFGYHRYGVHKNYVPARDAWQMCDRIPLSVGWIVCLYTAHAQYVPTVIFGPGLPTFELFCGPFEHWTCVGSVAYLIQSISCLRPQYWWQTSPTYFRLLWMWKDSASVQCFACTVHIKIGMMLTVSCCVLWTFWKEEGTENVSSLQNSSVCWLS